MKIVHVYKDYYPVLGGIENHVRMVAEEQAHRGHDVTVLVTSRGRRGEMAEANGVHLIKAGRLATVASAPISLSLAGWLRRLPCDIAHLHFPYPIGEMAYLATGRGRRMVITYHSDIVRQKGLLLLYAPLLRRLLQRADRIMPTNQKYVETSAYLRPLAGKCTVVPLGIDLDHFAHADTAQVEAIQRQYGDRLLIFVGRLRYYKGLEYLLRAMLEVPARLVVVGTGPMEKQWKALAGELSLGDKVVFLGDVDDADLPAYYHASSVFVLPSSQRSEAYGVSMLEGMACGLPAVSTELGTGTSFVNQDGQTGFVVRAADPPALAQAINRLLGNEELRKQMGQAAHDWAWGQFSREAMVDRILGIYQDVLQTAQGVSEVP
jgi:glycosyltransferase involved in cell wall biosynthesis